jgi:hypothetical protein
MSLATHLGVTPVTVTLTAVAVARGLRVTRNSSGLCAVQDASARGDYVTLRDGVASEAIPAAASGTPAKVPAVASEAVAVGDLAYSAAGGKFSKTSASAVLMGRWTQAASGDGVLGEVQLFTVA